MDKKGQGISLNVIIIAALALIVLVVLIAVFTGRLGIFQKQLGDEADTELTIMESSYGQCHPSISDELQFRTAYSQAGAEESEQEQFRVKAEAKAGLQSEVSRCKQVGVDKGSCDAAECTWG